MVPFDHWWNLARRAASEGAFPNGQDAGLTAQHVFREHAGRVYNLARGLLGNDSDAEDVTQEVLLQVVRKLATFRGDAEVTTWLHRITVNAVLLHRRKLSRRAEGQPARLAENLPADGGRARGESPPERQAMGREVQRLVEGAVSRLPALYRAVFVLADVEGCSNAQIGAALGLSLPAVKSRRHRARMLLRQLLGPHFAASPA